MTIAVAIVDQTSDTFGQWMAKTSQLANAMTYYTVTVNSNTVVGNSAITGLFSANSLSSSNTGFIKLGQSTSNVVAVPTSVVLQTSIASNNVITSTGMIIDGTVQYTKNFMSLGTSIVSTTNANFDKLYLKDYAQFKNGSTYIFPDSIISNHMNTTSMFVDGDGTIGDVEANVYISRDGIRIWANPTGYATVNSFINSTDLYIKTVHTDELILSDPTKKSAFYGNTEFYGANNYFVNSNFVNLYVSNNATIDSNSFFTGDVFFNNASREQQIQVSSPIYPPARIMSYANWYQHGNVAFSNGYVNFNQGINLIANTDVAPGKVGISANTTTFDYNIILPSAAGANGQALTVYTNDATSKALELRWITPQGSYSVDFDARDFHVRSIGVGTTPAGNEGDIRAIGNITAYYSSDKTLKENVVNIPNALEKVQQINGVEFDWTDQYINQSGGIDNFFTRKHDIGVIAQEIEQVLPEIVITRDDGTKAVKYDRIVALLIEAVKDLKAQVDSLKNDR